MKLLSRLMVLVAMFAVLLMAGCSGEALESARGDRDTLLEAAATNSDKILGEASAIQEEMLQLRIEITNLNARLDASSKRLENLKRSAANLNELATGKRAEITAKEAAGGGWLKIVWWVLGIGLIVVIIVLFFMMRGGRGGEDEDDDFSNFDDDDFSFDEEEEGGFEESDDKGGKKEN